MLVISKDIINRIYEQGLAESPIEACGYLAGAGGRVMKHYPMKNIDNSADHFSFDPKEQFSALKASRADGMELIGVYHTHPRSPARPSAEDIRLAFDPNLVYFIVSLMDNIPVSKAYRIVKGIVTEKEIVMEE